MTVSPRTPPPGVPQGPVSGPLSASLPVFLCTRLPPPHSRAALIRSSLTFLIIRYRRRTKADRGPPRLSNNPPRHAMCTAVLPSELLF